jgi:hypothetical protein
LIFNEVCGDTAGTAINGQHIDQTQTFQPARPPQASKQQRCGHSIFSNQLHTFAQKSDRRQATNTYGSSSKGNLPNYTLSNIGARTNDETYDSLEITQCRLI